MFGHQQWRCNTFFFSVEMGFYGRETNNTNVMGMGLLRPAGMMGRMCHREAVLLFLLTPKAPDFEMLVEITEVLLRMLNLRHDAGDQLVSKIVLKRSWINSRFSRGTCCIAHSLSSTSPKPDDNPGLKPVSDSAEVPNELPTHPQNHEWKIRLNDCLLK